MLYHYDAPLTGLPWTAQKRAFIAWYLTDFTGQYNKVISPRLLRLTFYSPITNPLWLLLLFSHNLMCQTMHIPECIIYSHEAKRRAKTRRSKWVNLVGKLRRKSLEFHRVTAIITCFSISWVRWAAIIKIIPWTELRDVSFIMPWFISLD